MRRVFAVFTLGFALSGCATLSREECQLGDWRGIGFQDGASGYASTRIGEHREACAGVGVTPDLDLWRMGYEAGLDTYCQPEKALQIGVEGATYRGVCGGPREGSFLPAYRDGLLLHEANARVERARSDASSARYRIDELKDDIEDARKRSTDPSLTQAERDAASQRIVDLSRDLGRAEGELAAAERAIWPLEREASDIRAMLYSRYPGWMRW